MKLISPAKINLFLRILKRRPDGYHELASLFQTINLCDTLHFSLSKQDCLSCTDPFVPTDSTNLVLKAADLFRRKTQLDFGITIHLEKNIPIQAGLGGGSSNAATTLWALNELCDRPATIEQLRLWSSEIGSDITFFLSEGTAYCTGRGEILRMLPSLENRNIRIIKPVQGLSTPQVYKKLDTTILQQRDPEVALAEFYKGNFDCFNDLEMPAFEIMPELARLKTELKSGGFSEVLMSGSGSAFFCLGQGKVGEMNGLQQFSSAFINRPSDSWYVA